jgi:uncharacterized protein
MSIRLRGHHLLCMLGFRGMGYSPEFTRNMASVYEKLRENPSTMVTLVSGIDDLCCCFPEDKPYHCNSATVHERDSAVLKRLKLSPGSTAQWSDILVLLREHIQPGELGTLCSTCQWRSYGVCEDGVARISSGEGLAPLPRTSS